LGILVLADHEVTNSGLTTELKGRARGNGRRRGGETRARKVKEPRVEVPERRDVIDEKIERDRRWCREKETESSGGNRESERDKEQESGGQRAG